MIPARHGAAPESAKTAQRTGREREIVARVAEGSKNREVAERLFISPVTVRHHLAAFFAKLGVAERLELIVYAFGHGLACLPRGITLDPQPRSAASSSAS